MGKMQFDYLDKISKQVRLHKMIRESMLRCAVILTMLLVGCDDDDDDNDNDNLPQFVYNCVDREADYACIDSNYYRYVGRIGNGYVMESFALGSHFYMSWGSEQQYEYERDTDYYYNYEYQYPSEDIRVISASIDQLTSGSRFAASSLGLTALIAINEDGEAIDYMYVSVDEATDIRLYRDGDVSATQLSEIVLSEGETVQVRGRVLHEGTYLRGTPQFDCSVVSDQDDMIGAPLSYACETPGVIKLNGVRAGETTLQIQTAGAMQEIRVRVVASSGGIDTDTGEDTGVETENRETDTHIPDTSIVEDGGVDGGGVGSDVDTGVGTDDAHQNDTELYDGGIDGGVDTDTGSELQDAGEIPDGGVSEMDASSELDAG